MPPFKIEPIPRLTERPLFLPRLATVLLRLGLFIRLTLRFELRFLVVRLFRPRFAI